MEMELWRARAASVLAAVSIVSVLVGCGGHAAKSVAATSTSVATTTTTLPPAPADLRTAIINQVPGNYYEQPTGIGLDGPLDLKSATLAEFGDSTASDVLQKFDFQRGYRRAWFISGSTKEVIIRVLLFDPPGEANFFYNYVVDPLSTLPAGETAFDVPGIANAGGVTDRYHDSTGSRLAQNVDLVRGPLFVSMVVDAPGTGATTAEVIAVAQAEVAKLASLGYP
jgi:hypothetical protein